MALQQPNRMSCVSIAKGIGILLVVLGHCITAPYLKRMIYLFHMPLFFFLSGYLFKDKSTEQIFAYTWKKVKGLYLPFVLYNCFALALHQTFCRMGLYRPEAAFASFGGFAKYFVQIMLCVKMEDVVAPLWFLPILMAVSVGFCVLRWLELRLKLPAVLRHILICGLFLGVYLLPNRTGLFRAYVLVAVGLFVFNMGYTIRNHPIRLPAWGGALGAAVAAGVLSVLACYFDVNVIKMQLADPITFTLGSFSGIYLTWYLSRLLEKWGGKPFQYCGDRSRTILAWHYYAFLLVTVAQFLLRHGSLKGLNNFVLYRRMDAWMVFVWTLIYFCVGVTLPLLLDLVKSAVSGLRNKAKAQL
ncbi:MAG: acyltransferase family protein [Oscillospiraceae bacterium]|nr:acyltransferase family protein [Oscillospiraceae bacterium]